MNRTHLFLLGLILVFAAALRVYNLSLLGYWTDELCTLSEANGHGAEITDLPTDQLLPPLPVCSRLRDARPLWTVAPDLARHDNAPPFYFLLLRVWEDLFGDAESAARSLNVVLSVAAVGLLFFAARPDVGSTAALWACLIMAVASPQIQYAQEVRNYVPAVVASLVVAIAYRRMGDRPSAGPVVAMAIGLVVMMLTHYYAAGAALAFAVHAAIARRGRPLRFTVAGFAIAAAAFFILWGWALPKQLPRLGRDASWLIDPGSHHVQHMVLALARLPVRWVADFDGTAAAVVGALLLIALPVVYAVRPNLRLWVVWVTVPTAIITAVDLLHHTTQLTLVRYTLFATPAAYVLIAAMVGQEGRGGKGWQRRFGWIVPATGVLLAVIALPNAYVPAWKIDLRTPTDLVARRLGPTDGLVISGPDPVFDAVTYAAFQHYLPAMPAASALLTKPADAVTLARLRQCPHVWVLWMQPDQPIDAFLPGYHATETGHLPAFGDLAVGRIDTPRGRE